MANNNVKGYFSISRRIFLSLEEKYFPLCRIYSRDKEELEYTLSDLKLYDANVPTEDNAEYVIAEYVRPVLLNFIEKDIFELFDDKFKDIIYLLLFNELNYRYGVAFKDEMVGQLQSKIESLLETYDEEQTLVLKQTMLFIIDNISNLIEGAETVLDLHQSEDKETDLKSNTSYIIDKYKANFINLNKS